MKPSCPLEVVMLLLLLLSGHVFSGAGQTPAAPVQASIECGAGLDRQRTCAANTSAGVVLVSESGDGVCVLGQTWGFDSRGIWTKDGCRGTFAFGDTRGLLTCSAPPGAERTACEADTAGGVTMLRGSASCVRGRTWGFDTSGVWVADGCDATFVLSGRRGIACSSSGVLVRCSADTTSGIVLVESTGSAPCVLGNTWGYDDSAVWVDRGCQATFVGGRPAPDDGLRQWWQAFAGNFNPYGRFVAHVAYFNDELEVQNNGSRIGLDFSTRGRIRFFAATEWSVNVVRGGQTFNQSANTDTGFPQINDRQADQVFGSRLGYVGVDFGAGGRVAIGKIWSVHSDISRYTDEFNVFGTEASGTYPAGTDGGATGTGRADQVLVYHNSLLGMIKIGAQVQFRTAENDEAIDGYAASAQVRLVPGFRIGAGYTKTFWNDADRGLVTGLDGDGEYVIVGARADFSVVQGGVVYMRQRNGDLVRLPGSSPGILQAYAVDAHGVEAFVRINLSGFVTYGGLNYYRPDTDGTVFSPSFRKRYAIAGAEFNVTRSVLAYAEARLFDDSVGGLGEETGFDVLTIGIKYGFSFKGSYREY